MFCNNLYFRLKPFIPLSVRRGIRRRFVLQKRERVRNIWPIKPGSEHPPEGWPGWPEGRQFAFVLTHDVESHRGLDRVMKLAKLEINLGFRSSFNFVPEGDYRVTKEIRDWLTDNGFEVGVHDIHHDGKLFRSQRDFAHLAPLINHYLKEWNAVGFRSGFMMRRLSWLHELDIAYDMSTFDTDPFEPQPEGMNTIFPFWVPRGSEAGGRRSEIRDQSCEPRFDNSPLPAPSSPLPALNSHPPTLNDQPSTINHPRSGYVELPYTLPQDSTLFLLLKEKNTKIWETKLRWLYSHRGMVLMNVHPDYVGFPNNGSGGDVFPSRLYEDFLRKVSIEYGGQLWNPKPRELAKWYSQVLS